VDDFPWLGAVLYVTFSALSLLFVWQKEYLSCSNLCHVSQSFSLEQRGEETRGNQLTQVHLENGC